jgi:hypothetical protein
VVCLQIIANHAGENFNDLATNIERIRPRITSFVEEFLHSDIIFNFIVGPIKDAIKFSRQLLGWNFQTQT